jgi:lysophospholipase L1-like esterase
MKKILISLMCLIPFMGFAYTKIGVMGDSISFPHPIYPFQCFHYFISKDLDHEGYPNRVINYSIGSTGMWTLLERMELMFKEDKPDVLIITLGIVDSKRNRDINLVIKELDRGLNYAKKEGVPVFLGTIDITELKLYGQEHAAKFFSIYDRIKSRHPEITIFPFLTSQFFSNSELWTNDAIHVNHKAHRIIADELKPLLLSWIQENSSN